jgi:signal transduction histidine kinase/DNA-binding response OmpR family regulator/PAS domain-containing protein
VGALLEGDNHPLEPADEPDQSVTKDAERRAKAELFGAVRPVPDYLIGLDWSATALGPVAGWDEDLRAAVRTVLPSAVPMLLWWGPELIQLYNPAYAQLAGGKHPAAAGQPAADSWAEIWHAVGPLAHAALAGGPASYSEAMLLLMNRYGYPEETYWTFSYSPIFASDGRVAGVFVATSDVTAGVVQGRRLQTLRHLGTLSAAAAGGVAELCRDAADVVGRNRGSVPFTALYTLDDAGTAAVLQGYNGLRPAPADRIELDAATVPGRTVRSGQAELVAITEVTGLALHPQPGPLGAKLPEQVLVAPLTAGTDGRVTGLACLGMNPYRPIDDDYRAFVGLIAGRVSTLISDAAAYQAERQRAKSLLELDLAKTRFFQNVSHEFRTPLTLLINVLHEVIAKNASGDQADRLEMAERATLRLRRLVDALLDFAQAEAGTLMPARQPCDLASMTAELAGMFSSAAESAGLKLKLRIDPPPGPVLMDREMWSQIVLNLLSNALKFTDVGAITVTLRHESGSVELTVSDTGIGIPDHQLASVFERFHQVSSSTARTREGAGIGLSLVRDLATALGGTVTVTAPENAGSTFTVVVPAPVVDTDPAQVEDDAAQRFSPTASALVNAAAAGRNTAGVTEHLPDPAATAPAGRLLLIEDDADLRAYLVRLLTGDGWTVYAAPDVVGALSAPVTPQLVLSDVMLPGTSGIEFVKLLRADDRLSRLPVILLTARAGSDSAAEGLSAGADDYVVKPFDPKELIARIRVHYELSQLREYALTEAQDLAANLRLALSSNREIGAAIGILMASRRVTADDAFDLLRRASQAQHRKLRDIAAEVTLTGLLPEGG